MSTETQIMTPEEKRIAIAEACGWVDLGEDAEHTRWWIPKRINDVLNDIGRDAWVKHRRTILGLPDYLNDLNAMHEAEKTLTREQQDRYIRRLFDVVYRDQGSTGTAHIWKSTTSQRAEAFLRTIKTQAPKL